MKAHLNTKFRIQFAIQSNIQKLRINEQRTTNLTLRNTLIENVSQQLPITQLSQIVNTLVTKIN